MSKHLKIVCIGNYVPRQCGIATFTRDLAESILVNNTGEMNHSVSVIAMNDTNQSYNYPEIVSFSIAQNQQREYIDALKFIHFQNFDICLLQHEFGIFGGDDGVYILSLIRRLNIPLVVTFHTVLKEPSYNQRMIVETIAQQASKIIVMNQYAVELLQTVYKVAAEKIRVIEHGIPVFTSKNVTKIPQRFHSENNRLLMTFGLLSRSKGIETVINALPLVLEKYPDINYLIIGKTHPAVVRISGEEYRIYLKRLIQKHGLEEHVHFYDRFVTNEELFDFLTACDIYITPYLNEAQITSGALSYAVGAGNAVISTPYWHAKDLLSDGKGILFPFGNSQQLAKEIITLLDHPEMLQKMKQKAKSYGEHLFWPQIGLNYLSVLQEKHPPNELKHSITSSNNNLLVMPDFNLAHIRQLTDSTGILQHAKFGIPNYGDGYCLDDNARAALLMTMVYRLEKDSYVLDLLSKYISYIHYMQNDNGTFKNFLSYDRRFLDETGSDDSFGRTIWALGYILRYPPDESFSQIVQDIFNKSVGQFENLQSIRGIAFTILGIVHYLKHYPSDENMNKLLHKLTKRIIGQYQEESDDTWHWFEPIICYSNGVLPLSLLMSYSVIANKSTHTVATESLEFITRLTLDEAMPVLIGNQNWYVKGGYPAKYAQQPVDAMLMVLLMKEAALMLRENTYLDKMLRYYQWFLGENSLGIPLYNFRTNGCFDGLEEYGVNKNQGAESSLSYLIAHLTVLEAFE